MRPIARLLAAAALLLPAALPRTVSLNGYWDFRYDYDAKGEAAAWFDSDAASGWTPILVPSSFDQALRNDLLYQGKAWYRTTFTAEHAAGERTFLHFGAVATRAKVWVNGHRAGEHLFPHTAFMLDVTDLLRAGPNRLVVLADNELEERAIPDTRATGWWNYGGINRAVTLETRPAVYTDALAVATAMTAGGWDLGLTLSTRNHGAAVTGALAMTLEDGAGRPVWTSTQTASFVPGVTETRLHASPRGVSAWTPATPVLYTLRIATRVGASVHESAMRIGFRQIEVKGTEIRLNGQRVFFRGVNYHEMYPGAGMTIPREQVRRDLLDMKALGANFLRTAHYPHDPQTYELADELGLMVWAEIPAWQTRAEVLGDDEVWSRYGAPQLREMVEQYRTHPSVVVWSVGNEFPSDKEPVARYVARACEFVRKLDPTRLVTFASDRRERDISFAPVDFIAINEYYGWYYGRIPDLAANLDLLHRKWPDKPIVVSEFGADSIAGWSNPAPPETGMEYTEDKQIKLISTHLGYMLDPARRAFMAGALVWVYADFPNPAAFRRPQHPPVASYMNCKGLVTDDRRRKRAWDVVKAYFTR